jgi:hypothetical protein
VKSPGPYLGIAIDLAVKTPSVVKHKFVGRLALGGGGATITLPSEVAFSTCTLKNIINEYEIRNSDIHDPHNTGMHGDVWISVVI